MRDQGPQFGPQPVVKIRHVKSSRVDPRVSRGTAELAHIVTSRQFPGRATESRVVYGGL